MKSLKIVLLGTLSLIFLHSFDVLAQPAALKLQSMQEIPRAFHKANAQAGDYPPIDFTGLAQQLKTLKEVTGAVYDAENGRLVFLGRSLSASDRPLLSLDDFVKALRVIYGGEAPAVSIDPLASNLKIMKVSYFGSIEDSHMGVVLFESDRLLKTLSMGKDNQTLRATKSNVPGYQSEIDLVEPRDLDESPPLVAPHVV